MRLFGTAGIRGITNADITPDLALNVARAYASIFKGNLAIARDTRFGAEMIQHAVMAGFLSSGAEVYDLGIVPLPVFARYVADFMDGGIIVTGSHTPPEIIGIVAVDSLGRDLYWDRSKEVEDVFYKGAYNNVRWDQVSDSKEVRDEAIEHYTTFLERRVRGVDGFSIVLDLANGSAAGLWDRILENFGIKVHCINCERKHIPTRPSEPRSTTLLELGKISHKYDLGAGVDVDADRVVFVHKEFISEDAAGAIFARRYAKRMVTPINSSSLVEYLSREYGIEVHYCPVGPPEIAEAMIKNKADFGYEETGKYVFPPNLWGDSLLSVLRMLEIMNSEGKSIEELASEFPKFYQIKEKIEVPRELKRSVVEKIGDYLEKNPPDGALNVLRVDGVKVVFEDSWLLIRASGTEDVVRIFSDASSKERAKHLVEYGKKMLKEFISKL